MLADSIVQEANRNLIQDIEASKGSELPSWVKGAAKLLNGGSEGQDWTALAKKLGTLIKERGLYRMSKKKMQYSPFPNIFSKHLRKH